MRIAVFGDIHGNISAFESFVKLTKDVDLYICLGDVVNYCPYSNECVDLLESLPNSIKIIGKLYILSYKIKIFERFSLFLFRYNHIN